MDCVSLEPTAPAEVERSINMTSTPSDAAYKRAGELFAAAAVRFAYEDAEAAAAAVLPAASRDESGSLLGVSLTGILTLEETAAYLRITPDLLRRLASGPTPKIGSMRQGRRLTFPAEVIDAYVTANTTAAAPPNPHGLTDGAWRNVQRSKRPRIVI